MEIISIIVHSVLIILLTWYFSKLQGRLKTLYFFSLLFKIACGIALGLIYKFHYSHGDTFLYFQDATTLSDLARSDPGKFLNFIFADHYVEGVSNRLLYSEQRAVFFSKVISFLALLTFDNYWLISIYCSLLSFFSAWFLFRILVKFFPQHVAASAIAFLFFPSVVFWTSGVIKETIACAALFFLTGVFVTSWFEKRVRIAHCIMSLFALWVLWNLKYYYAAVFLPVVFTSMLYRFFLQRFVGHMSWAVKVFLWIFIFAVPLLLITFSHPNFYPNRLMQVIVSNHDLYSQYSDPGDRIEYISLQPTFKSLLLNTPLAVLSGLFRPSVFEAGNAFQWVAAIENLIIAVLTLFAIARVLKGKSRSDHIILLVAVGIFVFLLADFLSLSTPNFGTLSRYRVAFLPFYLLVILCSNPLLERLQRNS
jgi:branched-subunit amino acid transport protein